MEEGGCCRVYRQVQAGFRWAVFKVTVQGRTGQRCPPGKVVVTNSPQMPEWNKTFFPAIGLLCLTVLKLHTDTRVAVQDIKNPRGTVAKCFFCHLKLLKQTAAFIRVQPLPPAMSFTRSRVTSLRLPCYCQMSCFTTARFYYGPRGSYTMGPTVECAITPSPGPCALTHGLGDKLRNGDSYISGNALWQRGHATMSACCYWKKQRAERRSRLLRSTSSVSPTAQRRDCLNLAARLVPSYVQMADENLRDVFSLGRALDRWQLQFHMTSYKFLFKSKKVKKYLCWYTRKFTVVSEFTAQGRGNVLRLISSKLCCFLLRPDVPTTGGGVSPVRPADVGTTSTWSHWNPADMLLVMG